MRALAACALAAAVVAPAFAQSFPPACSVPAGVAVHDAPLPRLAKVLADERPLLVVVVGSGSSAGAGVSDRTRAYPYVLQRELASRFPGRTVTVDSGAQRGTTAAQMVDWLERDVAPRQPALVVWQTGTADAVRGADLEAFGDALDRGIETLRARGIDTMLMDMQYGPQTDALIKLRPYREYMMWAARSNGVPLFRRHDVMQHWAEAGVVDLNATDRRAQTAAADFVHDCLGRLLARAIVAAARPAAPS